MARHGENIRKRKDGRWEGRYSVPDMETGKSRSCSVYARTYAEVKDKLSSARESARNTTDISVDSLRQITFDEAAGRWLQSIESKSRHSTCVKYRMIYETHIKEVLGEIFVDSLTQKDVNALSVHVEKTSSSIQKSVRNVTNQILSFLSANYDIPVYSLICPTAKQAVKPIETLTKAEQIRLLEYLCREPDIYKAGILLCLSAGLRLGEICALKWSDVDFGNNMLYINRTVQRISVKDGENKTALVVGEPKSCFSKREIPIADEMIKLLLPYKKEDGYIFKDDKPLEPRTYQNKYAKYLAEAQIHKSHFHILRHTFATNCINSGMDVKSLSEILGHADVKITLNRYVHPTMDTKRSHMNTLAVVYFSVLGQSVGQTNV